MEYVNGVLQNNVKQKGSCPQYIFNLHGERVHKTEEEKRHDQCEQRTVIILSEAFLCEKMFKNKAIGFILVEGGF